MTAVTRKILETPMAPYSKLLQGMSREDKKIVIMFLTESLAESAEETPKFKLSKEERKRGLMSLAGCWKDEDDAWVEESLAKFHDDWGGSGTPMEIAEELRNGVVNSRTVETW